MADSSEKNYSKLEWLFYIIILPMLFTAILSGVFMSFLGYDIAGTIRNALSAVPVVGNYIPDDPDRQLTAEEQIEQLQVDINNLENDIDNQLTIINELNSSLETRDNTIAALEQQIAELNKQLEGKLLDQQAWEENLAELARMYTSMPPNRAAPIISNLPDLEAIQILNQMNSADRAKILEQMNPIQAATLTSLMTARPDSESEEVAVLLAKIEQLNNQLDQRHRREERAQELASLYSNVSEERAAEVIAQMNNAEAVEILRQMSDVKRSSILGIMPSNRAAVLTQLLLN
ncbi:MotE family protein [Desulfuribacillus alkaliarsenatis]|uniref:Magnesium transporter MgtE intracellular domain-containing protein n=1 Tax=Desulfuribacillus alkaliarsenatis TaxID=766136 RepID=A0A1E5G675_9FIRM|nr:hypothetical protein [Desulfuribacillus alkaliarsenatis]OEF98609.1 hypothetical protein BHF68_02795 [Desulfuribacillus alkaliarsenatis]